MFDLSGKTAVVTGAANGIGKAICELFLERGARLVAADMAADDLDTAYGGNDRVHCDEGEIAELREELGADYSGANLLDPAAIEAMMAEIGGIDILVNNAGIAIAGDYETLTDEQFDRIMAVNVRAIFRLTRLALPLLKQSRAGRVINLGSIMSDVAGPGLAIYGTSKHAVAGLTKGMAVDFGPHGITANYLQPGAWPRCSWPRTRRASYRGWASTSTAAPSSNSDAMGHANSQ